MMSRQRFALVSCALAFAVAGCDSMSRPSESEIRQCVQATGSSSDSISQVEFGNTFTSQGGMMELAMGAPKGTKIFPVNIHSPSGGWTRVKTYWAFKDSFGKLQCTDAPGAESRTYQTAAQVAQEAEQRRLAAQQQAEQQRIEAEQARLQDEARKKMEKVIETARATATPLGQCECVDFAGSARYRFVITTASVSKELVQVSEWLDYKGNRGWVSPTAAKKDLVWFDEITEKPGLWGGARSTVLDREFTIKSSRLGRVEFYCIGSEAAPATYLKEKFELLEKAMDSWRLKYPSLAHW